VFGGSGLAVAASASIRARHGATVEKRYDLISSARGLSSRVKNPPKRLAGSGLGRSMME
jgi:hypothetical protein